MPPVCFLPCLPWLLDDMCLSLLMLVACRFFVVVAGVNSGGFCFGTVVQLDSCCVFSVALLRTVSRPLVNFKLRARGALLSCNGDHFVLVCRCQCDVIQASAGVAPLNRSCIGWYCRCGCLANIRLMFATSSLLRGRLTHQSEKMVASC